MSSTASGSGGSYYSSTGGYSTDNGRSFGSGSGTQPSPSVTVTATTSSASASDGAGGSKRNSLTGRSVGTSNGGAKVQRDIGTMIAEAESFFSPGAKFAGKLTIQGLTEEKYFLKTGRKNRFGFIKGQHNAFLQSQKVVLEFTSDGYDVIVRYRDRQTAFEGVVDFENNRVEGETQQLGPDGLPSTVIDQTAGRNTFYFKRIA